MYVRFAPCNLIVALKCDYFIGSKPAVDLKGRVFQSSHLRLKACVEIEPECLLWNVMNQ